MKHHKRKTLLRRWRGTAGLRVALAMIVGSWMVPPAQAWEIDFHFYTIYLLLRARGYSHQDSNDLAGFSQYVDDNAETQPIFQYSDRRAKFHFDGSEKELATAKGGKNGEKRIAAAFEIFRTDRVTGRYRVGGILHLEADSFSHAGFTAWWNHQINRRENRFLVPAIGHADAPDKGHRGDWPHRDLKNALEAARWLYDAIPPGPGPVLSWDQVEADVRAAFTPAPGQTDLVLDERIERIRGRIQGHWSDPVEYKKSTFAAESEAFVAALEAQ